MCEQCSAQCYTVGEVWPGVVLVRATATGHFMKPGDWGLVEQNDPFAWWGFELPEDPLFALDDETYTRRLTEDREALAAEEKVAREAERKFEQLLLMDARQGHRYVGRARAAGYDPEVSGYFHAWVCEVVRRMIAAAPQSSDAEP